MFSEFKMASQVNSFATDDGNCSALNLIDEQHVPVSVRPRKRKAKVQKDWVYQLSYETESEALKMVKDEETWAKRTWNKTEEGAKHYYRCNKVKKVGAQCDAELYLLYRSDSLHVDVFKTINAHVHPDQKPFTQEVKSKIEQYMMQGDKPIVIDRKLREEGIVLDNMVQIRNYLSRCKQKAFGNSRLTAGELHNWCVNNSTVPECMDAMYVLAHDIKLTETNDGIANVRVLITTKRLLSLVRSMHILHADGTHSLNWEGLPTIVIGTTDMSRAFRPVAIAVVANETREDYKFVFQSIADAVPENNIR